MSQNNSSKKKLSQSSIFNFFQLSNKKQSSQSALPPPSKPHFHSPHTENFIDLTKSSPPRHSLTKKIINDSDDEIPFTPQPFKQKHETPRFNDLQEQMHLKANLIPNNNNNNNNNKFDISNFLKSNIDSQLRKDPHCLDLHITKKYTTFSDIKEEEENLKELTSNTKTNSLLNSTTNKKPTRRSSSTTNKRKSRLSSNSDNDSQSVVSNDEGLLQKEMFANPENGLPSFLRTENLKDKLGRTMDDPSYDPTTLYVPDSYIKEQTPVMKQFWNFKKDNFDKILFFKLGKFYEMFYDDAIIGNQVLDLNWMGDDPKKLHVGFPEKLLEEKANRLVEAGYKVAVVEQTETPEQMKERNRMSGTKMDNCVKRELCQVFTKGTYVKMGNVVKSKFCISLVLYVRRNEKNEICYGTQGLASLPSSYFGELPKGMEEMNLQEGNDVNIEWGITIFDVTTLNYYIGQIYEDIEEKNMKNLINANGLVNLNNLNFTKIKTILYNLTPEEIIITRGNIPETVINFIHTLSCHPQITTLKNDYDIRSLNIKLQTYFGEDFEKWSNVILTSISNEDKNHASCMSIYFTIIYLEKILLASECLPTGNYHQFSSDTDMNAINPNKRLILDYQAITNLELIETKLDPKNPECGSLLDLLNQASTPFGKRMLKNWILNPLYDITKINERLDMIEDFLNNMDLLTSFRNTLSKWPDFERQCSQFFKLAMNSRTNVIYFEDVNKNRLQDFFILIQSLSKSIEIFNMFQQYINKGHIKSDILKERVTVNHLNREQKNKNLNIPNIGLILQDLTENFHMKTIKDDDDKTITIIESKPGVYEEYDECKERLNEIINNFDVILNKEKKRIKCAVITYAHTKSHKYELEIPEEYVKKHRPQEYMLTTSKKGYLRFHTDEILDNINEMESTQEQLKQLTKNLNIELFKNFYSKHSIISYYLSLIAELDCISTLAYICSFNEGIFKRPQFIDISQNNNVPYLELRNCVHPCLVSRINNFVPNDIFLGKDGQSFIVITGPNMGGKSTLLRQVCLSVIMAQIGCYVPADKCIMTPVDRIFTRIGASDRILEGKSTFYVEMEETKNILQNATKHSLVIMDELGRGTSTNDGRVIAQTIIERINKGIGCRTLFTTHYHEIINWCKTIKGVDLFYMDSNVNNKTKDISFLYKFRRGICPESYGISVAKLAGLPASIVKMAEETSERMRKKAENEDGILDK